MHHLPQFMNYSKKMDPKQKRRKQPKLDRRNAVKNIDYDATPSSSSSSYSSSLASASTSSSSSLDYASESLVTRSLDLSDRTSFRIEGSDGGEFARICRSIGLSGPEDFAIPHAAWEARKQRSSSDLLPRSRLNRLDSISGTGDLQEEEEEEKKEEGDVAVVGLADRFVDTVRLFDKIELAGGGGGGGGISRGGVAEAAGGINGVRPPGLAPPPSLMRPAVDEAFSTWDLFRAFGPDDGDGRGFSLVADDGFSSSEDEDEDEDEDVNRASLIKGEEMREVRRHEETAVPSDHESCFFTTSNDEDSSSTTTERTANNSPIGKLIRHIENWIKGELLGRGSFGSVYEGISEDGFFFAIKEVSLIDQGSQAKQSVLQLEQEIALLSQFQHENIVQYYGTEKDDSKLYIFLELVTKGSLMSLYQKYHLRDSQVSAYTRQILHGLKYLHDRNVVHRDIKCANILVDANGSVKLADFGLAKATKLNDVKSCKGTAFWMAPEVVNRKNQGYGLPADIWSLGCTVLEMLTRLIPYSHLECMQALFRIGKGEPPRVPDDLSSDARDFILQCLQANPNDRPAASRLLDHPFVKRPLSSSSGSASPYNFGRHV